MFVCSDDKNSSGNLQKIQMTRSILISDFFNAFDDRFDYAILHHVEDVFSTDSDIDLIVDSDKQQLLQFVKTFCEQNDGYCINHSIDLGTHRFNLIFFNNWNSFKIELDITFSNQNLLGINVKNFLSQTVKVSVGDFHFTKISDANEFDYYITKKASKREKIDSHFDYLKKLISSTNRETLNSLYANKSDRFSSHIFTVKKWLQKVQLLFLRINERSSLTICFLGPDGSGKSTIIEGVKSQNPFVNFNYFHLKPIKKKKNSSTVHDPHGSVPYSPLLSYLKLGYLVFQYNINWILSIWPLKVTPTIIIFDRYFDDIIADPKRYRYGGVVFAVKVARLLIPKPELTFVLLAETQVIYSRKKEVTVEELQLQLNRYTHLSEEYEYTKIDVSHSVAQIVNQVLIEILNKKKSAV